MAYLKMIFISKNRWHTWSLPVSTSHHLSSWDQAWQLQILFPQKEHFFFLTVGKDNLIPSQHTNLEEKIMFFSPEFLTPPSLYSGMLALVLKPSFLVPPSWRDTAALQGNSTSLENHCSQNKRPDGLRCYCTRKHHFNLFPGESQHCRLQATKTGLPKSEDNTSLQTTKEKSKGAWQYTTPHSSKLELTWPLWCQAPKKNNLQPR